ncbi:MAG: VanZ family protein [Clostridiales bacterium]|nr:VanZ family protein [Clostridiales bacterium]
MEQIGQVIRCIGKDLLEPFSYLPWGCLAGGGLFLLGCAAGGFPRRKVRCRRWALVSVWVTYLIVLLIQAFFSREPGSRTGIDLHLFETWGTTVQAHAYVVENVLMFVPFGVLLPQIFERQRSVFVCTLTGCVCSMALEFFQLMTQRGHCQLDDVVMNTLGTALGWVLYRIGRMILTKEGRREGKTE